MGALSNWEKAPWGKVDLLKGRRPREGARDGWIWRNEPFSVRGLYRELRTSQSEDPIMLDACRDVWKQRLPYKVAIFSWTLTRQRVLARVRQIFSLSRVGLMHVMWRT